MYDNAKEWIYKDFARENMTYGAIYLNDDYDETADEWSDKYLSDKHSPEYRTVIIKNPEEFKKIFIAFPVEINFGEGFYARTKISRGGNGRVRY